jgi:hypothetical protein
MKVGLVPIKNHAQTLERLTQSAVKNCQPRGVRVSMSDQLFASGFSDDIADQVIAKPRHGTRAFVYLAATATATLGWLWLIGWAVMQII